MDSRKNFLKKSAYTLCWLTLGKSFQSTRDNRDLFSLSHNWDVKKIASHWKIYEGKSVKCELCPNRCIIQDGDRGLCRVRENRNGVLYSLVYSRIAAVHIDPIEKKPLNHFMPGSNALSLATAGCNLSCKFCQNWQLSQSNPEDLDSVMLTPQNTVQRAKRTKTKVIAFTYNEPTVQYEYIVETSEKAKINGLKSVIISNGYILPGPSKMLIKNLSGVKIDLKAFNNGFYNKVCGGSLKDVLNNLETVFSQGKWLEIVTLVIPTLNDSPEEIREMAKWVKKNLGPDVPMHFTRFHSMYLIRNLPPTSVKTLEICYEIAKSEGIHYPYVGNVPGHKLENTYCHRCEKLIIKRSGFFSVKSYIKNKRCPYCSTIIPGVWV